MKRTSKTIEKILCPVGVTPASEHAFDYALELAGAAPGAVLHLVHAVTLIGATYTMPVPAPAVSESPEARAKRLMERLEARARAAGVRVECHIEVAARNELMHEAVGRIRPDLIVMGNEGRKGLERWLLGSPAEDMIRDDLSPVLTVPVEPDPGLSEPPEFRNVLVATDLSEDPEKTMKCVRSLVGETGDLRMLHVVSKPEESKDALESLLLQHIDAVFPHTLSSKSEGRRIAAQVEIGPPEERILETADRTDADVVVMNSNHGRGFGKAMFGSTIGAVLRETRRPVLTVPAG